MSTYKPNTHLAREAKAREERTFIGNTHAACGNNTFYTHNCQCVHCKDERDASNPKNRPKSTKSKVMTEEARLSYINGATVVEVVNLFHISEHTIRNDLKERGLLRSRGKRKQLVDKPRINRKPSYNDKVEQKESVGLFTAHSLFDKTLKSKNRNN